MGKGTILSSIGEGKYRVKLSLSTERITARIEELAQQIVAVEASIASSNTELETAMQALRTAEGELSKAIADMNAKFASLQADVLAGLEDVARYQGYVDFAKTEVEDLQKALKADLDGFGPLIEDAQAAVDEATSALSAAQSQLAADQTAYDERPPDLPPEEVAALLAAIDADQNLVYAKQSDLDVATGALTDLQLAKQDRQDFGDDEIAAAQERVKTAEDDLKPVQDKLDDDQEAWDNRHQDIAETEAKIGELETERVKYRAVKLRAADLAMKRLALQQDKRWMEAHKLEDPEIDAWCADLTEDLEGIVGTIEIPGEIKKSGALPVIIRPGYEERATYKTREQFDALLVEKQHAFDNAVRAEEKVGAADAAVVMQESKIKEMKARQERIAELIPATEKPDGLRLEYLTLTSQIEAATATLGVMKTAQATMAMYLIEAHTAYAATKNALAAAKAAEEKPRSADGMLQAPAAVAGPFSSFFNRALLPAWQKWKPLYRLGAITAIADPPTDEEKTALNTEKTDKTNQRTTKRDAVTALRSQQTALQQSLTDPNLNDESRNTIRRQITDKQKQIDDTQKEVDALSDELWTLDVRIKQDHCTVAMDPAFSSQQDIDVVKEPVLHYVPMQYMECNGAAFNVDDRVVVEFEYHALARPKVIGFEANPKPCPVKHGIFVTPASELSPIGFGWPYAGQDSNPINNGWGKPGITAASLIEAAELPSADAIGGTGFQMLITPQKAPSVAPAPPATPKYLYGKDRDKALLPKATVLGGAWAVTGKLPAEYYDTAGKLKPTARFDVFSVQNSPLGPMQRITAIYSLQCKDKNLQSEGIFPLDSTGTSILDIHPAHWGENQTSLIYKNGEELDYTVAETSFQGADGHSYIATKGAVGVAVKSVSIKDSQGHVTSTVRRLLAVFTAGRRQFEGTIFYHHYIFGYADPPYDSFTLVQLIDLNYPKFDRWNTEDNRTYPQQDRIPFHANESGTIFSAVFSGFGDDFYSSVDSGTQYGTPTTTQVVHLHVNETGTGCTVQREPVVWISEGSGGTTDPWHGEGDVEPPDWSSTEISESHHQTFAIAYAGDTEKRLLVDWSRRVSDSRSGGWGYTQTKEVEFSVTFSLGATRVDGYYGYRQTVSAQEGTHRRYDVWADRAIILGLDFVHDVIYHERFQENGYVLGEYGEESYDWSATYGYQVKANNEFFYSGSSGTSYPSIPSVSDTTKELGLGWKDSLASYMQPWSNYWDAYNTIMPIRGSDGVGRPYAGAYFMRSWFAKDAFGNTLFVCHIPEVILPGDEYSSGGINFFYEGSPNDWYGHMHMDQFPNGIRIARYIMADGTVHNLNAEVDVPGDHVGWKFAGVF